MEFSAQSIADLLQGTVEGNPEVKVSDISRIEEGKEGTLSFLANPKYQKYLYETQSSIILVNNDVVLEQPVKATLIRVEDAYQAVARLLELYNQAKPAKLGVDTRAAVSPGCKLGENLYLGAFAFIGENSQIADNVKIYPQVFIGDNVSVGENTVIYPGVKIYHGCLIGANCTIHAGTVIGSDGFGFAPQSNNNYMKIPQIGNVIIGDGVEIGANVTIDRATIGSTIIGNGVKLDNLIQIAHNVELGDNTIVIAQAGIAGSTKIGSGCIIAAQAGIVGHLKIADKVIVGAQSGVTNNIDKEGEIVLGSPAYSAGDKKREIAVTRMLPNLYKRLNEMEKELTKLKDKPSGN